jgi:hypothetical protein
MRSPTLRPAKALGPGRNCRRIGPSALMPSLYDELSVRLRTDLARYWAYIAGRSTRILRE